MANMTYSATNEKKNTVKHHPLSSPLPMIFHTERISNTKELDWAI